VRLRVVAGSLLPPEAGTAKEQRSYPEEQYPSAGDPELEGSGPFQEHVAPMDPVSLDGDGVDVARPSAGDGDGDGCQPAHHAGAAEAKADEREQRSEKGEAQRASQIQRLNHTDSSLFAVLWRTV